MIVTYALSQCDSYVGAIGYCTLDIAIDPSVDARDLLSFTRSSTAVAAINAVIAITALQFS